MIIKLETIGETPKAYQLPNSSWIPKSVLDGKGLTHPYYKVKDWWLCIQVDNICADDELVTDTNGGDGKNLRKASIDVMLSLKTMLIEFKDLPEDVLQKWKNYWSGAGDWRQTEYEPFLWGNDCLPGGNSF